MNVSLNWLSDYLEINLDPEKIAEVLTEIGLEVEGLDEFESIKGGMEGIVIGHVKESVKHPNADKLSLNKVDVGAGELLQIVCGAPNIAVGQKVMVATVGTTLYTPEGEAWKIKKGNIRGEASEGMICSEDEVGLGADHSGIVVLPQEVEIGTLAKDYFEIEKDFVFEIGLTPNRSDATNHLGVAKDLAAALKINYEHTGIVKIPDVGAFKPDNQGSNIEVVVEDFNACPRYSGVVIRNLKIKESPDWLKNKLKAVGVRPINNIVDITNFVLHEIGQPLHAFDLDEIKGNKIIVKSLPEGSTFLSLDEQERKLSNEDLMICDGESNGMCIGGVFGGIKSGVKDTTTQIFLESAHFNPKSIRRSSMRHNLRTDAAKVFEKGSDPNVTVFALKRAALLMQELAGGEIASDIIDLYPEPVQAKEIEVEYRHVNGLIGVDIPKEDVRAILDALEMKLIKDSDDRFTVSVPTNKFDVVRHVDVIEEILRIYGFNKVPIRNQIKTAITVSQKPEPQKVRDLIGDYLAANGFFEMMAVSLTESRYYKEVLPIFEEAELVFVNNTSNIHLDIMRPNTVISILETVLHNQNRQQPNAKLFEFGKSYRNKENQIEETTHLSLAMTGQRWAENWLNKENKQADYYSIKSIVNTILDRLGFGNFQETAIMDNIFSYGSRYHRGPQELVRFGMVHKGLCKKMGIKSAVLFAEFNWDVVGKALKKHRIQFKEINKFPSMRRDLALVIDNSVKFDDIVAIAKKHGKKLITDINLFDVYENESQLGKDKTSYAVSFIFNDPVRTLKDKEVDKVMKLLIDSYEDQLGAVIRR